MKDKKGLKSPVGVAVLSVIVMLAIIIAVFVFMGTMHKDPLLKSFNENGVELSGMKNIKEIAHPELDDFAGKLKTGGYFSFDDGSSSFTGEFYDFEKPDGADSLYDDLKSDLRLCVKKGNYVFLVYDSELDQKLQKIIDSLPGEYVSNR